MHEQGGHRECAGQLRHQLHTPPRVATACLSGADWQTRISAV
jgi:hypothetical protein